jgi:hypothetical protein
MANEDRTKLTQNEQDPELDALLGDTPVDVPAEDPELDSLLAQDAEAQSSGVTPTMEDYNFVMETASDVLTQGSPQFEELLVDINNKLAEDGWSSEDIAKVNFPGGVPGMEVGMLNDQQMTRFRELTYPILMDNKDLLFDEADVAADILAETGQEGLSQFDWSSLRQYVGWFQERSGQALGHQRKTWSRWQRHMSEGATEALRDPGVELDAGLLLLDGARWLDAKWKLKWIGEHDHKDLQNRALEPIVFRDRARPDEKPQEFTNGFTAMFHVLKENAGYRAQELQGWAIRDAGVVLRKMPVDKLKEIGAALQGSGQVKAEDAREAMRNLEGSVYETVALAGQPVEWYQIMESYVPEEGVDAWYEDQYEAGLKGQLRLGAYALGSGMSEFVLDPTLAIGGIVKASFKVGRVGFGKAFPEQARKIAEQVAKRTYNAGDAKVFLDRAEDAYARANTRHLSDPTVDSAREVQAAWQARANAQSWNQRFNDVGDVEAIAIRTPKRQPETISLTETRDIIVGVEASGGVSTAEAAAKELTGAQARLARVSSAAEGIPETRVPPRRASLTEEVEGLKRQEQEIKEVALGLNDQGKPFVISEKDRMEQMRKVRQKRQRREKSLEKLADEEPNPDYTAAQKRVKEAEGRVADAEAKQGMTVEHGAGVDVKKPMVTARTVDDLAEELHQQRLKAAQYDAPQPIPDWDEFGPFDPVKEQRVLFGPDDTEQAADGLAQMVQSGGTSIDDIATTTRIGNPTPELDISPGRGVQDAWIDWKAIDRHNDITKLERQWKATGGGRQLNLFETQKATTTAQKKIAQELRRKLSAQRLAIRQRDLANKRGGKLRNSADAKLRKQAQHYQDEAKRLGLIEKRIAEGSIKDGGKKVKWLPVSGEANGLMKDPGRFNRWLEASGHRLHRSLYPGGVAMNMMEIMGGIDALTDPIAKAGAGVKTATGIAGATGGAIGGYITGGPMGAASGAVAGGLIGSKGTRAIRGYGHALSLAREPHRFFNHYAPREWAAIRANYENYHQQSIREFDKFTSLGEKAGLLKPRKNWVKSKFHGPYEVDKELSEKLFDIADIDRATDEGVEAYRKAVDELTPEQQRFLEEWDGFAKHAADQQGIHGDERITGYIHHVWTKKDFANGAKPTELNGIPANGSVWASHLIERGGEQGFQKDIMLAMDYYIRGKNRVMYLQPMYQDILDTGKMLSQQHGRLGLYEYTQDLVRDLKGQPTFLGTRLDQMIGTGKRGRANPRGFDRQLMGLTAMWWAGSLPGNPRYPIMQVATAVATTSGRFGLYRTGKGLFMQATEEGRMMSRAAGVERQIQQVFESDTFRKAANFVAEAPVTISPMGLTSVTGVENFIRGMTFHASVDMQLTKYGYQTLAEASADGKLNRIMFDAMTSSEQVNHVFGAMGRSPYLTRMTGKGPAVAATQFLSFVPKQIEELASQAWRDPGMIAEYMAISGAMTRIAATEMGVDLTDYVGLGFTPKEPGDMQSPAVKALTTGMQYLAAWSEYNKEDMDRLGVEFTSQMEGLLPLMAGQRSGRKTGERLQTGELTSSTGRKERNLDFKGEDIGSVEGFARAIDPNEKQGMPALGGDLLATVGGQQSIQDRLYYAGKREITRSKQNVARDLKVRVRNSIDKLEDGDMEGFQEQFNKIASDFNLGNTSADPFINEVVAREISWTLRNLDPNSPMVMQMLETAKDYGIKIEF